MCNLTLMHNLIWDFCPSDQRFAHELVCSSHPASFRFHLTMVTLAFGYILPTTGRIRDFNPLETCAARRTHLKNLSSDLSIGFFSIKTSKFCPPFRPPFCNELLWTFGDFKGKRCHIVANEILGKPIFRGFLNIYQCSPESRFQVSFYFPSFLFF